MILKDFHQGRKKKELQKYPSTFHEMREGNFSTGPNADAAKRLTEP